MTVLTGALSAIGGWLLFLVALCLGLGRGPSRRELRKLNRAQAFEIKWLKAERDKLQEALDCAQEIIAVQVEVSTNAGAEYMAWIDSLPTASDQR